MAMGFRESNAAKWVGTRPGHNGTQINKYNHAINGYAIIHTVTAGKTFYLTSCGLYVSAYAAGTVFVSYRDAADTLVCFLLYGNLGAVGNHWGISRSFWPPLEIPAGFDVTTRSSALVLDAYGDVVGWEE